MNIRTTTLTIAVGAVITLAAGCTSAATTAGAPQAMSSASACPSAEPEPTDSGASTDGITSEPLPAEVRCLPGIAYGSMIRTTGAGSGSPTTGDVLTKARLGLQLMVNMKEDVSAEDALHLCGTLTAMGYGPGGRKGVSTLAVSAGLRTTYISLPDRPSCRKVP
ncbi:hypothetical protein [Kitasatospora paranensis]|uniref:Lipoprotein n=1 Tax=Kitasatospora paranensis TaxID=258053 RepID=A0ABW2G0R1_9ACTN